MMGEPGSYDARVYDHFDDKDKEGLWFSKRFNHIEGITISLVNVCLGQKLPEWWQVDGIVLAGSYNSVHDNTHWQHVMRSWIPKMRARKIPILAICGSHQLLAHMHNSEVVHIENGAYAGTFPIKLTEPGRSSPLFSSIPNNAEFQFANSEHVVNIPSNSTLLATSGKVPVAALDFGDHCYSTQFHPEGTYETLGTVWRYKLPENMKFYHPEQNGKKLVENFLELVIKI